MYVFRIYKKILENKCRTKEWLPFNATRKRNTHWSRWYRALSFALFLHFSPHFEQHRPKIKTVTQNSKFNATFLSSTFHEQQSVRGNVMHIKELKDLARVYFTKKLQQSWSWIYMWNQVLFEGFKKLENHSQCLVCEAIIHLKPTHSSRISKEE